MHYRTLIISDLHLGAPDAKYKHLEKFLSKHTFDHLILNGDIIDGLYLSFFNSRKEEYTNFLEKIIELTNKHCKITYLKGNHDNNRHKKIPIARDMIEIKTNMIYKSGEKTYFIAHGQQLDGNTPKRMEKGGFIIGIFIYRLNRKYNERRQKKKFEYQSIVAKIKNIAKIIMVGNSKTVDKKIKKICIQKDVNGFICGHLHHAAEKYIDNFHYLNSGDRVESMTAVVETHENKREVVKY